jgi:hypothetical protein
VTNTSPLKIHLACVIWGAPFVERFLRLALRSLWGTGNIEAIAAPYDVTFQIHTTPEDQAALEASPLFDRLHDIVDVMFVPFKPGDGAPHNHMQAWRWAADYAKADGAAIMFVAPDHILPAGTLLRWSRLLMPLYRDKPTALAIIGLGIQVTLETIGEEFPGGEPISLPQRDVDNLILRHLHPMNMTMLAGAPRAIQHPEIYLRPVPGAGYIHHTIATHAIAFWPGKIAMGDDLCPLDQFEMIAYESTPYLSAEPLLKLLWAYYRPWRMDDDALRHFGCWADFFVKEAHVRGAPIEHPIGAIRSDQTSPVGVEPIKRLIEAADVFARWRGLRDARKLETARQLAAEWMAGHALPPVGRISRWRGPRSLKAAAVAALVRVPRLHALVRRALRKPHGPPRGAPADRREIAWRALAALTEVASFYEREVLADSGLVWEPGRLMLRPWCSANVRELPEIIEGWHYCLWRARLAEKHGHHDQAAELYERAFMPDGIADQMIGILPRDVSDLRALLATP